MIVYCSCWIYRINYRLPLSLRGAKRRGNLLHSRRMLFEPINMVNSGSSMLSTLLRYQSTVQEIPTGLTALGMTSFFSPGCKVFDAPLNDHLQLHIP